MIRKACKNDVSRLAEIELFVNRYNYNEILPKKYLYNKISFENTNNMMDALIKDMENNRGIELYVLEEENIIKGYFSIGFPQNGNECELINILIDVPFQNKKLGTLLMDYCMELVINKGKKLMSFYVYEKNIIAIKFYEKYGFKMENKYFSEELNINAIKYQKNLE
jgi:ribosomal protein S18 acetylase RimI-like enzyme